MKKRRRLGHGYSYSTPLVVLQCSFRGQLLRIRQFLRLRFGFHLDRLRQRRSVEANAETDESGENGKIGKEAPNTNRNATNRATK